MFWNYRRTRYNGPFANAIFVILCIVATINTLFFQQIDTLICAGGICNCYQQTGTFGMKKLQYKFRTDDILKHTYKTSYHRESSSHGSYRTHTDYSPVLYLKDGRTIELPLQFCRNQNRADEFVQAIKSKKYTKKSNIKIPFLD